METLMTTTQTFMAAKRKLRRMEGIKHQKSYSSTTKSYSDEIIGINKNHRGAYNMYLLKMDLSTFRKDNPQGWIRKCKRFSSCISLQFTNMWK
jgi:hypothetical protein